MVDLRFTGFQKSGLRYVGYVESGEIRIPVVISEEDMACPDGTEIAVMKVKAAFDQMVAKSKEN